VSDNEISLVTFPSHTTNLLKLLDGGVYKPLKEGWRKEVEKFMTENPEAKLDFHDFNRLFVSAYCGAFQPATVRQLCKNRPVPFE
jgi:hypothetical protein